MYILVGEFHVYITENYLTQPKYENQCKDAPPKMIWSNCVLVCGSEVITK